MSSSNLIVACYIVILVALSIFALIILPVVWFGKYKHNTGTIDRVTLWILLIAAFGFYFKIVIKLLNQLSAYL